MKSVEIVTAGLSNEENSYSCTINNFSCIISKRNLICRVVTITVYMSHVNFPLQLLTTVLGGCWYIII